MITNPQPALLARIVPMGKIPMKNQPYPYRFSASIQSERLHEVLVSEGARQDIEMKKPPCDQFAKILVVENDRLIVAALRSVLSRLGHKVAAANSDEAMALLSSRDFDLVVCPLEENYFDILDSCHGRCVASLAILTSDSPNYIPMTSLQGLTAGAVLSRPLKSDALAKAVSDILRTSSDEASGARAS